MTKINELIDSLTNDNAEELKETLKAEASALTDKNSQLYVRAKKSEGFEYDKEKKEWVKKEKQENSTPKMEKTGQPGEFGYGEKAFLVANGIKEPDEIEKVKDFMASTGKDLEEAVNNKYLQSELKDLRDDKAAKAAMPDGTGRSAVNSPKSSVDYWLNKSELPPADQVELRRKVVNARYQREKAGTPFTVGKK